MPYDEGADRFFLYARERYRIHLRREGKMSKDWTEALPKSGRWTNDRILQQFRFCNVFREDDKTTKFLREQITIEGYGSMTMQAFVMTRNGF